jgi:hypothetical protein
MAETLAERAAKIGAEHGKNAASWVFDGNTDRETYARVLKGIEEGDPAVLAAHNVPSLSAEYMSEGYGERDLAEELDIDPDGETEKLDSAAEAYRLAAGQAFWDEVERAARYQLS